VQGQDKANGYIEKSETKDGKTEKA